MLELYESVKNIGKDVMLIDTPYGVKDILMNKPNSYRILYDALMDFYLVAPSKYVSTHCDMYSMAYRKGYYGEIEEFIAALGGMDNYWENGLQSLYIDEEDSDFLEELSSVAPSVFAEWAEYDNEFTWLYCMQVVVPDDKEDLEYYSSGGDDYSGKHNFEFGTIFTRDFNWNDLELADILSRYSI